MMEAKELRKADFVTSIILIGFGVWELFQSFQMPMRDTFGGVRNVWYVSPALMPLVIGFGIVILGSVLLVNSIRTGGAAAFIKGVKSLKLQVSDSGMRFAGVLLAIGTFVYLLIPRVDFFMSIVFFLSFFIPAFAFDSPDALRKLMAFYGIVCTVMIVVFATPLADALNGAFQFATDVVILIASIGINVYAARIARGDEMMRSRFRTGLIVAIVTPLILTPVFRFFLLVPLPHEGGIVQLMQVIYYSIR